MSVSLFERDNDRSLSANQNQDSHKIVNFKEDDDFDPGVDEDDPLYLMELANLR